MSTTLSTFLLQISSNLGLDNSGTIGSSPTKDQTLMIGWVNEAIADVVSRTKCNVAVATLTLTAGDYDYTLDTHILALDECFNMDVSQTIYYRLQRVTAEQILNYRVGNQFINAPPVRWYALSGANLLMLYPTPLSSDVLTFYYVPRPTALAAASDTNTQIPAEWQKAVEYYGCWQAAKYMNDSSSQMGALFMTLYETELIKLKKAMRSLGGRKLAPAVVGNRTGGRQWPIGEPSQQGV